MKLTTKPTEIAVTLEVDGEVAWTDRGQRWVFWTSIEPAHLQGNVHEFEGLGFFKVVSVFDAGFGKLPVLRAQSIKPEAVQAEDLIGDHHD